MSTVLYALLPAQVVRFQQWQAERKEAAKEAQRVRDAQDAVMTQLAVQEADERVQQYSQLLLDEVKLRGQPVVPLARHVARGTKQRHALTPTM
jgi:hypothetical protein